MLMTMFHDVGGRRLLKIKAATSAAYSLGHLRLADHQVPDDDPRRVNEDREIN